MSALAELAVRCEAGSFGDDGELLEEAFRAVEQAGLPVPPKDGFEAALNAKAYESAAWSLAPADWSRHLCAVSGVGGTAILMRMDGAVVRVRIEAATAAMAMTAALLIAWDYTLANKETSHDPE